MSAGLVSGQTENIKTYLLSESLKTSYLFEDGYENIISKNR
jgi:hypothetical protein